MSLPTWRKRKFLKELVAEQRNRCALCGLPFTEQRPATLDHIIPKSAKPIGLHRRNNLQAAHESCNGIRSSMPLEEFRRAVELGLIILPDADGNRPSKRLSKRARRGLARLRADIAFDAAVWRGESRTETRAGHRARLRAEVDRLLGSD